MGSCETHRQEGRQGLGPTHLLSEELRAVRASGARCTVCWRRCCNEGASCNRLNDRALTTQSRSRVNSFTRGDEGGGWGRPLRGSGAVPSGSSSGVGERGLEQ